VRVVGIASKYSDAANVSEREDTGVLEKPATSATQLEWTYTVDSAAIFRANDGLSPRLSAWAFLNLRPSISISSSSVHF
jgi:hypothetical protein